MSGSFTYRHHVEPRVKLYSPREESFPVPLKYIDPSITTWTNLDVMQEKRIDDYWNIDGSRDLSGSWTSFTQFTLLEEIPPDGYTWSGRRLIKRQVTSRPNHFWPELWKNWEEMQSWRRSKNGPMKNQNSIMQEDYEEFLSLTPRTSFFFSQKKKWKHQWLQQSHARLARKASMVKPVAILMISSQNLRVSWKPMNQQECVWKNLYQITMRTI